MLPSREGHGNPLQSSCLLLPWQRSLAGYSPWGSQRVRHDWATKHSTAQHAPISGALYLFLSFPGMFFPQILHVSLLHIIQVSDQMSVHFHLPSTLPLFMLICCCSVTKSCLTLLWPHGLYSPPGSSIHRISQARMNERKWKSFSHVWHFVTPRNSPG